MIAKKWPNTPENLEDFIEHPERMLHGTGLKSEMTMSNVSLAMRRILPPTCFQSSEATVVSRSTRLAEAGLRPTPDFDVSP